MPTITPSGRTRNISGAVGVKVASDTADVNYTVPATDHIVLKGYANAHDCILLTPVGAVERRYEVPTGPFAAATTVRVSCIATYSGAAIASLRGWLENA